jgi:hypothetical protein
MSQEKSWKVLPTEEKTSTHYSVPSLGALEYVSEKKKSRQFTTRRWEKILLDKIKQQAMEERETQEEVGP